MSVHGELADLAVKISGAGWQSKLPEEWTPEQAKAFEQASTAEKNAWLEAILDEPIPVETDHDA